MPACSSGRSGFYQGRRRRPLAENQTSDAPRSRRECPRSGSIGVKDARPMASARSRLVTWSYTHLSFHGRRFWRPHPDLDRAATPALPPGGGRPFAGRLPLLAAVLGCFATGPANPQPGAGPRNPRVRQARISALGGLLRLRVAAVAAGVGVFTDSVSQVHRGADTDRWVTNGSFAMAGPLLAEPFGRSVAYAPADRGSGDCWCAWDGASSSAGLRD